MTKRIIVASHRRSGTHLTIDSIINNFDTFRHNPDISLVTLDHLSSHVKEPNLTYAELKRRIDNVSCVLKTHSHGNLQDFFVGTSELKKLVEELFATSKIIYVHRDGRDTMVSLYHYHKKFDKTIRDISFSDYIRMTNNFDKDTYQSNFNRIEYWAFHVRSWLECDNCLFVSFDDFQDNYLKTLNKISEFIDEPINTDVQDTRRQSDSNLYSLWLRVKAKIFGKYGQVKYSSVGFRKGKSGEWREYFSSKDIDFFNDKTGNVNQLLGYK